MHSNNKKMHSEVKGNIQWMIWDAWSSSQLDDFGWLGNKGLNKVAKLFFAMVTVPKWFKIMVLLEL